MFFLSNLIFKNKGFVTWVALPFTLTSILRQKKNYGNSNISPCKKYKSSKNPPKETQNPSRYYYNSLTNLKFQDKAKISSFKNSLGNIKIDLLFIYLGAL